MAETASLGNLSKLEFPEVMERVLWGCRVSSFWDFRFCGNPYLLESKGIIEPGGLEELEFGGVQQAHARTL